MQMTLPRMDVPVSVVEWELFLPDQYRADRFAGTAIAAYLVDESYWRSRRRRRHRSTVSPMGGVVSGQIVGRVLDAQGGSRCLAQRSWQKYPGQRRTVVTGADGRYVISNLPAGPLVGQQPASRIQDRAALARLRSAAATDRFSDGRWRSRGDRHGAGRGAARRHAKRGNQPDLYDSTFGALNNSNARTRDEVARRQLEQRAQEPSLNVQSLQRRAAGVLPVRIDVPRAGTSHRFLKPLVVDEETVVQFRYKRR